MYQEYDRLQIESQPECREQRNYRKRKIPYQKAIFQVKDRNFHKTKVSENRLEHR